YPWYRRNLERNRNYARWIEYSISSSVMVVLIAMLTGISDVAALGGIFGVNAAMILFGLLVEHYESPGRPNWMSYWFGVLAGAVPWIVIGIYIFSPGSESSPPTFVYAIFISLFIFFNSFAINMVLQYRKVGRWADYLFGEKVYIVLSLTAKSLLAWQVFGGTLAS
ncbi:MAG: heliorhodopsin HeR, partial [Acidimicrobiia bacterium]|nr:heliorhodopsin HeR [Acidimicrobiia bacterium]